MTEVAVAGAVQVDWVKAWSDLHRAAGGGPAAPVENPGTACQAGPFMVSASDLTDEEVAELLRQPPGAIVRLNPDSPIKAAFGGVSAPLEVVEWVPTNNEVRPAIKPLSHWRGVENAQPGEPGWQKLSDVFRRVMAELLEAQRAADESAVVAAARAPFPAKALRTRPWEISALVE